MDAATHSQPSSSSQARDPISSHTADMLSVYAPEPNALERRALSFLDDELPEGAVPIGADERRALKRLQRRTVLIGVASGTVSGLLLGGLEIWLTLGIIGDEDRGLLDDPVEWGLFYAAVGIVTLVEILFLYWITLRAVARLKRIVGVPGGHDGMADLVRAALARAALESPNPEGKILGVDPHAFKPRWLLYARDLVYKAKVGVTSFILRIAMRRLFVRAVLRSYVPLLAAPLYAAWNAWILHRIMEEARVRAFGPFAVRAILDRLEEHGDDPAVRDAAICATVALVRRSGDGHPNYVLLLHGLKQLYDLDDDALDTGEDEARAALQRLPDGARARASELLVLVAILSGRPSRRQSAFLLDAHRWLGRPFPAERLGEMRRHLRSGERLYPESRPSRTNKEAERPMQLETGERFPTP